MKPPNSRSAGAHWRLQAAASTAQITGPQQISNMYQSCVVHLNKNSKGPTCPPPYSRHLFFFPPPPPGLFDLPSLQGIVSTSSPLHSRSPEERPRPLRPPPLFYPFDLETLSTFNYQLSAFNFQFLFSECTHLSFLNPLNHSILRTLHSTRH